MSSKDEDKEFDKKFSEIMKSSNIEDLDSFIKTEAFKSIKDNILLLHAINDLSQEINSIIMCIVEENPIEITVDMQESLATIYKLALDFVEDMIELNAIDIDEDFDIFDYLGEENDNEEDDND